MIRTESKHIYYTKGDYKYQLKYEAVIKTKVYPYKDQESDFFSWDTTGLLVVRKGYAWDGPSGEIRIPPWLPDWLPTIRVDITRDSESFMRASLAHDAGYQAIREGLLGSLWREIIDNELKRICLEDKMNKWYAEGVYDIVRNCAGPYADPKNRKKIYKAP